MLKKSQLESISQQIMNCQKCDLWGSRSNTVPGEGDLSANVMFIGEAPGFNEDKQGKPFVGRAGKILDELLGSIDLSREMIFIANILKCRPPENRNPKQDEIISCKGYLDDQISLIEPRIIVPLGNFACQYIFKKFLLPGESIGNVHGKVFKKNTLSGLLVIIPMYHPAVATYNPTKIIVLKEDMKVLKDTLDPVISITDVK